MTSNDDEKMLTSNDGQVRLLAWERICQAKLYNDELFKWLLSKTEGNKQFAEDVRQEAGERICEFLQGKPLKHADNVDGFVFTVVRHVLLEKLRNTGNELRRWLPLDSLEDRKFDPEKVNVEDVLMHTLDGYRAQELLLYLPDPIDRLIMLLYYYFDMTQQEIAALTSRPDTTVNDNLQRSRHFIWRNWNNRELLKELNPWARALSLIGGSGPFGVYYINIPIIHFAPDAQQELQQLCQVKHTEELRQRYFMGYLLQGINGGKLEFNFSLQPRADANPEFLEGSWMHYLNFEPQVYSDVINGKRQKVVNLRKTVEFKARIESKEYLRESSLWVYQFPEGPVTFLKPLTNTHRELLLNPMSQKQAIFVFQPLLRGDPN
ncbi:MAG: sigma-70 family RNA polymerase sigma factor [Nitrososphaera sp.]|nr:sigma-70 family RNA polymerase sigma factor [Nitrososphaera sp.]